MGNLPITKQRTHDMAHQTKIRPDIKSLFTARLWGYVIVKSTLSYMRHALSSTIDN